MKLNRMADIGVLCDYVESRSPKNSPEEEFSYIDIAGIDREQKLIAGVKRLMGSEAPSRARQVVQTGDVLVSTVRPNLNAVAMVPEELNNEIASTGFCVLRAKEDQVLQQYLFYVTQSDDFIRHLVSRCKGAGYPAVTEKTIKTFGILVPQLKEQARIVELLDQADALRKLRSQADEKAARILPALFHHYFGDPHSFNSGTIRDLVVRTNQRDPRNLPEQPFRYIDIASVDGSIGVIGETKEVMGVDAPSRARKEVKTNDIIISTVRPYLKATALIPDSLNGEICSTGFCVLRPVDPVTSLFLYAYSRLDHFSDSLMSVAKGAAYPAVSDRVIFDMPIPDLSQIDVQGFNSSLQLAIGAKNKASTSKQKLEDLFQLLLNRAFTGELTAQWREDHMSELVEEMEIQAKA